MTPKEKAKELVDKYFRDEILYWDLSYNQAKLCALIAVDEMLNYFSKETFMMAYPEIAISELDYWQEVKQEIEAL
jgi:hypothetical protein